MPSRRNLLKAVGLGVASGASRLRGISARSIFEPLRPVVHEGPIFLNSTENAFGPSAKVLAALEEALPAANHYARGEYENLAGQIAGLHRVRPEQVLLGCGSREILEMAASAFLGVGKRLVIAAPAFDALTHYAELSGTSVVRIPLNRHYSHDLEAMLAQARPPGLVYISNPSNPMGTLIARNELEAFISKLSPDIYVLMDEAYHHYAGASPSYSSFIDRPLDHPRLIVTRTFSKIYGMAGLRLGYGIASSETIERMRPFQLQFGVTTITARAALAALADVDGVTMAARRNADDRQDFINRAQTRNYNPIPSHTNFVTIDTELPAEGVIEHFRKNNILVSGPFPPLNTFIRISLGTPSQMQEFWRVWDLMGIHRSHH